MITPETQKAVDKILEMANNDMSRLMLMNEIGAFAFCKLSEEQIVEQSAKYLQAEQ